ncbi:hypothetical protein HC931_09985 [Candidatus Gracilibacteria bacterium]|nr:hypothetical protein [Candidatus Gracilibacteria bacterium]NJM89487.1 hypothetical protein [Hydrococcus sp. RU_2_2]NJP20882.1 hypothetical protein [Hydrococcus sp. CRU_1_1]
MKIQKRRLIVLLGLEGSLGIFNANATMAQMPPVLHRLPPPPPLREAPNSESSIDRPVESTPVASKRIVREYLFQAPSTPLESNNLTNHTTSPSGLYRVEVIGVGQWLLSRVRIVEPSAFIRRGETVIQAGLFTARSQAEQRLSELARQGISARVVPVKDRIAKVSSVSISRRINR